MILNYSRDLSGGLSTFGFWVYPEAIFALWDQNTSNYRTNWLDAIYRIRWCTLYHQYLAWRFLVCPVMHYIKRYVRGVFDAFQSHYVLTAYWRVSVSCGVEIRSQPYFCKKESNLRSVTWDACFLMNTAVWLWFSAMYLLTRNVSADYEIHCQLNTTKKLRQIYVITWL